MTILKVVIFKIFIFSGRATKVFPLFYFLEVMFKITIAKKEETRFQGGRNKIIKKNLEQYKKELVAELLLEIDYCFENDLPIAKVLEIEFKGRDYTYTEYHTIDEWDNVLKRTLKSLEEQERYEECANVRDLIIKLEKNEKTVKQIEKII